MTRSAIVNIVDFCVRRAWLVAAYGVLIASASIFYSISYFSVNTNTETLISRDLPWRQRNLEYVKDFPQSGILVVVTASTAEGADQATTALVKALSGRTDLFANVAQAGAAGFFERNAFMYQPLDEVRKSLGGLSSGSSLIEVLSTDPSSRGVMNALALVISGVERGNLKLDQLEWPLTLAERPLRDAISGGTTTFSWQTLLQGSFPPIDKLRRFIEVDPILNFADLQPGLKATTEIEQTASNLKLASTYGARVQLTGTVPMNDDQFSVIRTSAMRDTLTALIGTLIVLWLALRSWKIVVAVFSSVIVGLSVTAALGLAMVGSFNLLSIAFFVLFVGLGVDFGIRFCVRYRSERFKCSDFGQSVRQAAYKVSTPLSLAAAATAVAFFSFIPTDYVGLFELGLIAGCGMIIASICAITIVPALLAILQPPGELTPIGFPQLAALDHLLQRHRMPIVISTILAVVAGSPLLLKLPFDFNPINLQDPNAPSVVAYRELLGNPITSGTDADIVTGSLDAAGVMARHLVSLPEVSKALTLKSFVPVDQDQKLAAIKSAAADLRDAFAKPHEAAPTDEDTTASIRSTASALSKVAGTIRSPAADRARQFSELLMGLVQADATARSRATAAFVPSLVYDLNLLQSNLGAEEISVAKLPAAFARQWILPDGRARVEILPKGDANNASVLRQFAMSVLAAQPSATGPAISLYLSGETVIHAFIEAGVLAFAAIAFLLLLALRRVTDVLFTLTPLLLAGAITLELCTLTHTAINFANIIALPLLLGVGVAFKIYYVVAWRAGKADLLQSSLTRAIVFSAMTTAVAFGSMWASSSPGMSSMGRMMALALVCTMIAAVLFQPLLMGPPRHAKTQPTDRSDLVADPAE